MDKDYLIQCIEEEGESSFFDFKKDIYDLRNVKEETEFIKDVLCFANGHSIGDKYIITGVKLQKDNITRDIKGITESKIQDGSDYQNLIDDNVEPSLIIDFTIVEYNNKKFGIFKIGKENIDRPYMMKKKFQDLDIGFMKMRVGQRNVNITRRELDKIYNSKIKEEMSNIVLKGIVNDNISDGFEIKHIEEDILKDNNLKSKEKEIRTLFNAISKIHVEETVTTFWSNNAMINNVIVEENVKKEITDCSKVFKITMNDDFFNLGNLTETSFGLGRSINGTDEEKNKNDLINRLYEKIIIYKGLLNLKFKFNKVYYSELLVQNTGNKFDDEVHVALRIKRDDFVNFLDFPVPSEGIVKYITDEDYLDRWIKIKKHDSVDNYNCGKNFAPPIYPQAFNSGLPGKIFLPEPKEYIDYYHEYIDYLTYYDIIFRDGYYIVKFVVNNINPNQMIFLPSRLFFTKDVKNIEYEINSKYNPKVKKGKIEIIES